jgi:hypothetical protein
MADIQVMRKILRSYVPQWVKNYRLQIWHKSALRRSWLNRSTTPADDHLSVYWNSSEQPNRQRLIEVLVQCLPPNSVKPARSVLEYGSHVGINLKLLHDRLQDDDLKYFAIEPNREAFEFLKTKLDFVEALNVEDKGFVDASNFPGMPVDLSFINSVFYCVAPNRAKAVLRKLVNCSQLVVIGDAMDNLEGNRSIFSVDPPCYQHPYRKWLRKFGFDRCDVIPVPDPRPQLNGFVIATRGNRTKKFV